MEKESKESKVTAILSWINIFMAPMVGLLLYFLNFGLYFWLTEVSVKIKPISSLKSTLILCLLLFISSLVDWHKLFRKDLARFGLITFFIIAVAGYIYLSHEIDKRFGSPKIYQFHPINLYQAEVITIKGANFGPKFKKGEVVCPLGEFSIIEWSEQVVRASAPVPSRFGETLLQIKTAEGELSNEVNIIFKDPGELVN